MTNRLQVKGHNCYNYQQLITKNSFKSQSASAVKKKKKFFVAALNWHMINLDKSKEIFKLSLRFWLIWLNRSAQFVSNTFAEKNVHNTATVSVNAPPDWFRYLVSSVTGVQPANQPSST